MSKLGIISAVMLALGVMTASAQIRWDASQWEAYTPANRFAKADTEVLEKKLVITPNWVEGK